MATDAQLLHVLQHSLGVDEYGRGEMYRNYFCTGAGTVDYPVCMEAVRRELMSPPRPGGKIYGDMDFFYVTELGKAYVRSFSPVAPVISRSKRRYARFLAYDGSLSFRDFLTTDMAKV